MSTSVRMASSAPSTPSTPSNLPPVGWVSRCEPMAMGARSLALARPGGEHVAHLVDLDRAAQLLAFGLEPVAHLLVLVRHGEALDAALGRAAELRGLHQRVPQALRIDGEIGLRCHDGLRRLTCAACGWRDAARAAPDRQAPAGRPPCCTGASRDRAAAAGSRRRAACAPRASAPAWRRRDCP